MKQDKVETLNFILVAFFFVVGLAAWILLGCGIAASVQRYEYLFLGGYELTINVYAIFAIIGWATISVVILIVGVIGWLNEDDEEKPQETEKATKNE